MPMLSQAQNRAMHAAASGRSSLGIPQSVGQDFVGASHGMSVKSLPKRLGPPGHLDNLTLASAKHLHSQGMITAAHHMRIKRAVGAKAPAAASTAGPFGSLAPQSAGHYMSTAAPVGTDESGGRGM